MGNPLYMSGDQSPQAAKAQAFAEELRTEFGITVHLWDERLTTTQAHRHLDDAGHAGDGAQGDHRPGGGGADSAVVSGGPEPMSGAGREDAPVRLHWQPWIGGCASLRIV